MGKNSQNFNKTDKIYMILTGRKVVSDLTDSGQEIGPNLDHNLDIYKYIYYTGHSA